MLFFMLCFAASEASYNGPYKENYLRAGFAGPLLSRGSSAYIRVCISSSVLLRDVFFLPNLEFQGSAEMRQQLTNSQISTYIHKK